MAALHEQIKLTFSCTQDWNSMDLTSKGRYCTLCQREVLDLTDRSVAEILQEKAKRNGQLCARIITQESDPDLIAPVAAPRFFRFFALASSLVLALSTRMAFAQKTLPPPPTELFDASHRTPEKLSPVVADSSATEQDTTVYTAPSKPFLTTERKEYYWSKKAPFIKRTYKPRPRIHMGFL